ncbi:MAG: chemotaxis protein [Algisphaera sp.]
MPKTSNNDRILLETGTNELEILVFEVGGQRYGVNVAKVREVIMRPEATPAPGQSTSVRGMTRLRGKVLMVIDLHAYLGVAPVHPDPKAWHLIVTEFNGIAAAFDVENVDSIYRISWDQILPAPEGTDETQAAATGIAEINEELVMMLDFESIYSAVVDHTPASHISGPANAKVDRGGLEVWSAEDSAFIRHGIERALNDSGYTQHSLFNNGKELWTALVAAARAGSVPDVIMSDIEMAQMDGLHLCKKVKGNQATAGIHFVLYSSLITDQTRHKSERVGADAQVNKPKIHEIIDHLDRWAEEKGLASASAAA